MTLELTQQDTMVNCVEGSAEIQANHVVIQGRQDVLMKSDPSSFSKWWWCVQIELFHQGFSFEYVSRSNG